MLVLGIDAAWTTRNPSGVALVEGGPDGWRLIECRASYGQFLGIDCGHTANPLALLARSAELGGRPVDLVAVDMPMARSPISKYRESDRAVSREFGARHCSTHTPSVERPGRVSDRMREAFEGAGYPLATDAVVGRAAVEVYPHTALLALTGEAMRLRYKYGNTAKYWRGGGRAERREKLISVWAQIVLALDGEIEGVESAMPLPPSDSSAVAMKAFEDTLDAVVCAWVGACVLEGRAKALGDGDSAIWVPLERAVR